MPVQIAPLEDRRAEEILDDADQYFDDERKRVRQEVQDEMTRKRDQH